MHLALLLSLLLETTAAVTAAVTTAVTKSSWLSDGEREKVLMVVLTGFGALLARLYSRIEKLWDARAKRQERRGRQTLDGYRMLTGKDIEYNCYAEQMRLLTACDHVEVYGATNGEYLRSGDSIEKFIMVGESASRGEPRFIDCEGLIYSHNIPFLVNVVCHTDYALMWPEQCEDESFNRIMRERGYSTSLAVLITVTAPKHGQYVLGMFVLNWKHIALSPVADQRDAEHLAYVTPKMKTDLLRFKLELGDIMIRKEPTD